MNPNTQVAAPSLRARIEASLIRRQRERVLRRSPDKARLMAGLAALAFLPERNGGLRFDAPLQPLSNVRLAALYRRTDQGAEGEAVLRVFRARFDASRCLVLWGGDGACGTYDPSLRLRRRWRPPAMPLSDWPLVRLALDVDLAQEGVRFFPDRVSLLPRLPRVLLAVPEGAPIRPQPTPVVLRHQEGSGLRHWGMAWDQLHEAWGPAEREMPPGLTLVDARLCPAMARGWAGVWLDLSPVLGVRAANPARHAALEESAHPRANAARLRAHMSPDLSAGCSDEDLLEAIADHRSPLIASGMPRALVWRPRETSRDGLAFAEGGHGFDLWHDMPSPSAGAATTNSNGFSNGHTFLRGASPRVTVSQGERQRWNRGTTP